MAKKKALNGKDLMLFTAGEVTALSTSHKLSLKADTTDASSKDDGMWDESTVTKMSWEATTEALIGSADGKSTEAYDDLFDKFVAGEAIEIISGVPSNIANEYPNEGWSAPKENQTYYTGKALITTLDWTAGKGDNAKMTISLKGVGPLKKVKKDA